MKNIDLGKSQITEKIRVSSAAIWREMGWNGCPYWIVETWIFSDDPRQQSRQVIHGTPQDYDNNGPYEYYIKEAKHVHAMITKNLRKRHGGWRGVFYRHMWS